MNVPRKGSMVSTAVALEVAVVAGVDVGPVGLAAAGPGTRMHNLWGSLSSSSSILQHIGYLGR